MQCGTLKTKIDEVQELADFLPNMYVTMARGLLMQFSEDPAVVKAILVEKKTVVEATEIMKGQVAKKKLIKQKIKEMDSRLKVARADKIESEKDV